MVAGEEEHSSGGRSLDPSGQRSRVFRFNIHSNKSTLPLPVPLVARPFSALVLRSHAERGVSKNGAASSTDLGVTRDRTI